MLQTLPGKMSVLINGYTLHEIMPNKRRGQKGLCCRVSRTKCKLTKKGVNQCKRRTERTHCGWWCTRFVNTLKRKLRLQMQEEKRKAEKKKAEKKKAEEREAEEKKAEKKKAEKKKAEEKKAEEKKAEKKKAEKRKAEEREAEKKKAEKRKAEKKKAEEKKAEEREAQTLRPR